MPKDNETFHIPLDGPIVASESTGFSPDQMIRCDGCLRANPPTRVSCIYCRAALQHTEASAKLRRPTLRQPEANEPAYNCICLTGPYLGNQEASLANTANFLKLTSEDFLRIVHAGFPMPLARTASSEEADLVVERLRDSGYRTLVVSDATLGVSADCVKRARSLQFEPEALLLQLNAQTEPIKIQWNELFLLVSGLLVTRKVEVQERMSRRAENELLHTDEFFADEAVFDLYSVAREQTWRVGANSFDFSCLQNDKTLVASQNLKTLRDAIASKAPSVVLDDSYHEMRTALETVWPSEKQTQSRGWKRQGPGRYSLGNETLSSNEVQFTRYSRLRRLVALGSLH